MRQRFICIVLVILFTLTACAEGPAIAPPNQRQQTSTTLARLALTPKPTRTSVPTATPFVAPTARATVDVAPVTVTPFPTPVDPNALPTEAATNEPTSTPATPTTSAVAERPQAQTGSLFFTRNGAIWRYDLVDKQAREFLPSGSTLRVAPDGSRLAVLRDGVVTLINSDGSDPQLLIDTIIEAPVWAPDSSALAVVRNTSSSTLPQYTCASGSEVVVLELASATETVVGAGCQPSWDPQSARIAYITEAFGSDSLMSNALNLVNRQGENGWTVVNAPVQNANFPDPRRLFFQPFWSADGATLYAFGNIGYRVLSEVNTLEAIDPINGGTVPIAVVNDILPRSIRVNGDSSSIAYTRGGAKGTLALATLPITGETQVFDYLGTPIEVQTEPRSFLEHAYNPTWSPNGDLLAVLYCRSAALGICDSSEQATIRLYNPRSGTTSTIIKNVDVRSFLEWGQ